MPRGPNGGSRRTHQINAAYGWVISSPQSYTDRSDGQLAVARIMTCLFCSATVKVTSTLRRYLHYVESSRSLSTSIRNRSGFIPRSQRRLGASANPLIPARKTRKHSGKHGQGHGHGAQSRGFGCRVCTRQPCIQRAHGLHPLAPDKFLKFPNGHAVGAYACETLLQWLEVESNRERSDRGSLAIGHHGNMKGSAGDRDCYPVVRRMGGISSSAYC